MPTPTQQQMFYAAQRKISDTLQHAAWMAGLVASDPNPNPLTRAEIKNLAESKWDKAWAYEAVLRILDNGAAA